MHFINAQPMDITPALREIASAAAIKEAGSLAANSDWPVSEIVAAAANPPELKPRPI
jgi:FMN-dependent NADH-azoreductase